MDGERSLMPQLQWIKKITYKHQLSATTNFITMSCFNSAYMDIK